MDATKPISTRSKGIRWWISHRTHAFCTFAQVISLLPRVGWTAGMHCPPFMEHHHFFQGRKSGARHNFIVFSLIQLKPSFPPPLSLRPVTCVASTTWRFEAGWPCSRVWSQLLLGAFSRTSSIGGRNGVLEKVKKSKKNKRENTPFAAS